jgi:prevent-host-death family protein
VSIIPKSIMKPLKTVTVAEFEGRCKDLMELVRRTRQPLLITRKGKPLAQISPYISRKMRGKKAKRIEPLNPLEGSVLYEGDLISPIDEKWDTMP